MMLLRTFLPLRLKGASADSRKKIADLLRRWLLRLKASTFGSAQLQRDLQRLSELQRAAQPTTPPAAEPAAAPAAALPERLQAAASRLAHAVEVARWLRWLGHELLASLYPGAPYDRVMLPLELYQVVRTRLAAISPSTHPNPEATRAPVAARLRSVVTFPRPELQPWACPFS